MATQNLRSFPGGRTPPPGVTKEQPISSASKALGPGSRLADTYVIKESLARGGMGEVYLAEHERLPGLFAVKCLQTDLLDQDEIVARFRREAEIVAGLRHPNVVQVFDFNVTPDGMPYLVMEFLEGDDLASVMARQRHMSPADVLGVVQQVGQALEAAHALGIVHRDLKPENVVLMRLAGKDDERIADRLVKVIDFGISFSATSPRITGDAHVLGTPHFMSPEQAQGRRDLVDARADQFSLAVMTYMMLSGQSPFRGETPLAVMYNVVHEDPRPLGEVSGVASPAVDEVLRKGMARERDDRFASVQAFLQALEQAMALQKAPAAAIPSPSLATPAPVIEPIAPATWAPVVHTPTVHIRRRSPASAVLLVMTAFVLTFAGASTIARHVSAADVTHGISWVVTTAQHLWAFAWAQ